MLLRDRETDDFLAGAGFELVVEATVEVERLERFETVFDSAARGEVFRCRREGAIS